jgi:hypothetical protein
MSLSEREAGDILRRVMHLEDGVKELRSDVKGVDDKVDAIAVRIDTTFARFDGGWKVLIFVGGLAGALSAAAVGIALKMWPFLLGTLPKV